MCFLRCIEYIHLALLAGLFLSLLARFVETSLRSALHTDKEVSQLLFEGIGVLLIGCGHSMTVSVVSAYL